MPFTIYYTLFDKQKKLNRLYATGRGYIYFINIGLSFIIHQSYRLQTVLTNLVINANYLVPMLTYFFF